MQLGRNYDRDDNHDNHNDDDDDDDEVNGDHTHHTRDQWQGRAQGRQRGRTPPWLL